jgi:NAD-reducing hydrogenase small subunit
MSTATKSDGGAKAAAKKIRLATNWFDACSGCHMSVLDIDEKILDLLQHVDIVYGPLVDIKEVPENIDVSIVEGAIASYHDLELIQEMRDKSDILVALGDCAINGNVPSMRNYFFNEDVFARAYEENVTHNPVIPTDGVPKLLRRVRPVHEIVKVDLHIPGCPPPSDAIYEGLKLLLEGTVPEEFPFSRFGK